MSARADVGHLRTKERPQEGPPCRPPGLGRPGSRAARKPTPTVSAGQVWDLIVQPGPTLQRRTAVPCLFYGCGNSRETHHTRAPGRVPSCALATAAGGSPRRADGGGPGSGQALGQQQDD